jgi:hypothetical protein
MRVVRAIRAPPRIGMIPGTRQTRRPAPTLAPLAIRPAPSGDVAGTDSHGPTDHPNKTLPPQG